MKESTITYGELRYNKERNVWTVLQAEPHVWIKLKANFPKIPLSATTFNFSNTPENCADLLWFTSRYPLKLTDVLKKILVAQKKKYTQNLAERHRVMLPSFKPKKVVLKEGYNAREYQLTGADFYELIKRMLLADEFGLGKTLTALLAVFKGAKKVPALVICQAHLAYQWEYEINLFTNLRTHIINTGKIYNLPASDVYIIRYTVVAKWINVLTQMGIKYLVLDEVQELRRTGSQKYEACDKMSESVEWCQALSATPIFNYGEEIFNIYEVINKGCLGKRDEFAREWVGNSLYNNKARPVKDPNALGAYLRSKGFMLRRTREEVGLELPPVNKIIHNVEADEAAILEEERLLESLAMQVLYGDKTERFEASGTFDMRMRQITGIAKAKQVAGLVKMIVDNGEPVILGGWHRAVYDIWAHELKEYNPAWFTGSETGKEKFDSAQKFINGDTDILMLSMRSGAGLNGLEKRCSVGVHGELDWSPEPHNQLIHRLRRGIPVPGEIAKSVMSIFPICNFGSDPQMVQVLGLKASQARGISDPFAKLAEQHTDQNRIKVMAENLLNKLKSKKKQQ